MKGIVYYDINKTAYNTTYEDFKLYFSSEANMRKFNTQVEDYIETQTFYLYDRYSHVINIFRDFFIIAFYKKIEKRGFKVIYKENIELKPDCVFDTVIKDANFVDYYEREV